MYILYRLSVNNMNISLRMKLTVITGQKNKKKERNFLEYILSANATQISIKKISETRCNSQVHGYFVQIQRSAHQTFIKKKRNSIKLKYLEENIIKSFLMQIRIKKNKEITLRKIWQSCK